uniref:Secreted salivary gland peptide n=1 Tax=Panagrellus redivivus TaxID=6233 RepID=A0A7E4UW79_PANRE
MQLLGISVSLLIVLGIAHAYQEESQDEYSPAKVFLLKRVVLPQNVYVTDNDASGNWFTSAFLTKQQASKRAIPMSGGIYGKRSAPMDLEGNTEEVYTVKRAVLPFSGGIYGKRSASMRVPFSGGIYGKRGIALRSLPISGGIYG